MGVRGFTRLVAGAVVTTMVFGASVAVQAQEAKKIKIGVIYDYSGPFAGGGSELHALGAKIMLDYLIKKGGVEGYQVEFEGEGAPAPGQNDRASPVIIQYVDDKPNIVWPKSLQLREPVLPLPASSPFAAK